MKKIWKHVVNHVKEDFTIKQYGFVFLFLASALYVNYALNFDDLVLRSQKGFTKLLFYFLFFSSAYYITLLPLYLIKKNSFFSKKEFWIKSLIGLFVLSLDSSVPYLRDWIESTFEYSLQFWAYKVSVNLISFFTILFPLLIFYLNNDRKENHFYGLKAHRFDARPYFYMLLIMLPVMIAASFHPSFIKQYPMYKPTEAHILLNVPEWFTILIYEIAYGMDFLTVEFLFRGFFVIGMIQILGRHSVLPMAVIYCFLHTGKPLGEAISSIFGGYLLGVVAYETKSIWGGVIVHLGIAWLMEVIGFVQKCLNWDF
jgi:hypothetical protein